MSVHVPSKLGPYDVHLGPGALAQLPEHEGRVAIIHPETLPELADRVAEHYPFAIRIPVPEAEKAKTATVLNHCWDQLAEHGFTRSDLIVGVGGGTTTDLAGFVAATWLRGVDYVSVPTTVLAMVDAGVGGKTGINLPAGKNLVGAFHEPVSVFCDFTLLETLPDADIRAGMAEVIKCGFIKDPEILVLAAKTDRTDIGSATFAELVRRAVQVKADVVVADFKESTSVGAEVGREALNYGHTLGHAIEAHAGYTWRHGEAISVGMSWIARVSQHILGLDEDAVWLHDDLLASVGMPKSYDTEAYPELRRIMGLDKKSRGTSLRLVGLAALGTPTIIEQPDEKVLAQSYQNLSSER